MPEGNGRHMILIGLLAPLGIVTCTAGRRRDPAAQGGVLTDGRDRTDRPAPLSARPGLREVAPCPRRMGPPSSHSARRERNVPDGESGDRVIERLRTWLERRFDGYRVDDIRFVVLAEDAGKLRHGRDLDGREEEGARAQVFLALVWRGGVSLKEMK